MMRRGPHTAPAPQAQDESAFFEKGKPGEKPKAKKGGKPGPYLKRGRQNWERGKDYGDSGGRNKAARLRVLATAQRQQQKKS